MREMAFRCLSRHSLPSWARSRSLDVSSIYSVDPATGEITRDKRNVPALSQYSIDSDTGEVVAREPTRSRNPRTGASSAESTRTDDVVSSEEQRLASRRTGADARSEASHGAAPARSFDGFLGALHVPGSRGARSTSRSRLLEREHARSEPDDDGEGDVRWTVNFSTGEIEWR